MRRPLHFLIWLWQAAIALPDRVPWYWPWYRKGPLRVLIGTFVVFPVGVLVVVTLNVVFIVPIVWLFGALIDFSEPVAAIAIVASIFLLARYEQRFADWFDR